MRRNASGQHPMFTSCDLFSGPFLRAFKRKVALFPLSCPIYWETLISLPEQACYSSDPVRTSHDGICERSRMMSHFSRDPEKCSPSLFPLKSQQLFRTALHPNCGVLYLPNALSESLCFHFSWWMILTGNQCCILCVGRMLGKNELLCKSVGIFCS